MSSAKQPNESAGPLPTPGLLSLPPELFDMICDYLLPVTQKTMYNHHHHLEFAPQVNGRRISKSFAKLASTCKSAHWQCQNAFKPKVLRVTIGHRRFGESQPMQNEAAEERQRDRLTRGLVLSFYRDVSYVCLFFHIPSQAMHCSYGPCRFIDLKNSQLHPQYAQPQSRPIPRPSFSDPVVPDTPQKAGLPGNLPALILR